MNYIFGVDGGGTGCRVGLADKDGNILSRVEGGPANIETSLTTADNNIVTTCKKALVQAGLKESILKESFAVLGLAGSNMGDFDKELSKLLPFKDHLIINDGEIVERVFKTPMGQIVSLFSKQSIVILDQVA